MIKSLLLLLFSLPLLSRAEPADLAEILAQLRHSDTTPYQYQETRHLELLTEPLQSQGYMLSDATANLVKLQLQPQRIIMAVSGDRMLYWDAAQDQRHSLPLSEGGPAAQQISVFRALLQGRLEEMAASYDFAASRQDRQWTLKLTPKADSDAENSAGIEISGDAEDKQRRIVIRQADGESTEYHIVKAQAQPDLPSLEALLREAAGD